MSLSSCFASLKTVSSTVSEKNMFNRRSTVYVPDFFLMFFCLILFSLSAILDVCIIFNLTYKKNMIFLIIFVITSFPYGCVVHLMKKTKLETPFLTINKCFLVIFYLVGFGPSFICISILLRTFTETVPGNDYSFPYPFFHIPNESLAALKIYCLIHSVTKSIPQFCIMTIIIRDRYGGSKSSFTEVSLFDLHIIINTLIFCQTIATTYPIQTTPKVFKTCDGILLDAFNKFMATMCACCLHVLIFSITYQAIAYYAILLVLGKTFIWVFPCWRVLKSQPVSLSCLSSTISLILFTLTSSIIYIHPMEGHGKPLYYIFNLISFLFEIFCIYFFSELDSKSITFFFTLKPLMLGFLSCFGMVNISQKYKEDKNTPAIDTKTNEREENSGTDENEPNIKTTDPTQAN